MTNQPSAVGPIQADSRRASLRSNRGDSTAETRVAAVPRIVSRPVRPGVFIPFRGNARDRTRICALVHELDDWLRARGITDVGPPYLRIVIADDLSGDPDFEVGRLTAHAVAGQGRVRAGEIRPGAYATLVHRGHPAGLDAARSELVDWIATAGHEPERSRNWPEVAWGGLFEFYLTAPDRESDMHLPTTELSCLLRGPAPARRSKAADGATDRHDAATTHSGHPARPVERRTRLWFVGHGHPGNPPTESDAIEPRPAGTRIAATAGSRSGPR